MAITQLAMEMLEVGYFFSVERRRPDGVRLRKKSAMIKLILPINFDIKICRGAIHV